MIPRVLLPLIAFLSRNKTGKECGMYYIDSKKLVVCHNFRIKANKVFKGLAQRDKSSTGWFYGFKLFLVINPFGQIVRASITKGNVADNNFECLMTLLKGIKGKIFGDKGFLLEKTKYTCFIEKGLQFITKVRANMKNKLLNTVDKLLLNKRGVIESVFNLLIFICNIEHSRHRSPLNAFVHLFAGLNAYSYLDKLPSIIINKSLKAR